MPFLRFPDPGPPPVPVSAAWESGSSEISVVFDRPLAEGSLDFGSWSYGPSLGFTVIVSAEAVGDRVVLGLSGAPSAVNTVSYSPPPFDVVSATGAAAEGFSEFPVS